MSRDAADWRAHFSSLPPRELLRVIHADKAASARVFAGFRASEAILRHPVVLQRLVDEAIKQPEFAGKVEEIEAAPAEKRPAPPPPAAKPTQAEASPPPPDPKLKEKLKEQRAALRDKDARLSELEAALAASEKARTGAQQEASVARAAQRTAEEDAARQRKQRERDDNRRRAAEEQAASRAAAAKPSRQETPVGPGSANDSAPALLEEGLRRLLSRRRYAIVAEVCREALAVGDAADINQRRRGFVHALYAAALYGENDTEGGGAQDRLAAHALIDSGNLEAAAESLARLLTRAASPPGPTADAPTFRRLFTVAERMGQADAVRAVFSHLRIAAPEALQRLRASLRGAGKIAAFLDEATHRAPGARLIGPDEAVTLRGNGAITPRGAIEAVDRGDTDAVGRVRDGLRALRRQGAHDARLAEDFLEAVSRLDPVAALPLLQESGGPIVVDASNVARHDPDPLTLTPPSRLANLRRMRAFLLGRGFFPVILLADANLRYHVDDRAGYLDLLHRGILRETAPGTPADTDLIDEARRLEAPLVTNDRLSEWGDAAFTIERFGFTLLPNTVILTPF